LVTIPITLGPARGTGQCCELLRLKREARATMAMRTTPSFAGLRPASKRASTVARASSKKGDTRCEVVLRRALWAKGLRYRLRSAALPGRPDIVFASARVAVFCDGDFWHGRDLDARISRLKAGHNAPYWVAKITANVARDRRNDQTLAADGWIVLRFWERDIIHSADVIAAQIAEIVVSRRRG